MEAEDTWLADIAASQQKIMTEGFYMLDGQRVDLEDPAARGPQRRTWLFTSPLSHMHFEGTPHLFSKGDDGGFPGRIGITYESAVDAGLSLTEYDLLIAAGASPRQPAEGFQCGQRGGLELDLCRRSTLYASLASEAALPMYEANRRADTPLETDCMILSAGVRIFRDQNGMLLSDPVTAGVLSVAAPDLAAAELAGLSAQTRGRATLRRIRTMLRIAGQYQGGILLLDGWAGASGQNDPEQMACYFERVLIEENFVSMFDTVIFALPEDGQREAFARVFRASGANQVWDDWILEPDTEEVPQFTVAAQEFPQCNYTESVSEDNLGYTTGLLSDGTPFAAEWYISRRNSRGEPAQVQMAFLLPSDLTLEEIPAESDTGNPLADPENNVIGYHGTDVCWDRGVLDLGMLDAGQDCRLERTMAAAEQLEEAGLLEYTSSLLNGALFYRYDEKTEQVMTRFNVTVWEDDELLADTPLRYRPFPVQPSKPHLVLVSPGQRPDAEDDPG